jgi:hypothetical protein
MRERIVSEITKALAAKLPPEDVPVVIDKSGMSADGTPILVYSGSLPDLSQLVIKTLIQSGPTRGSRDDVPSFSNSDQMRFASVDLDRIFRTLSEAKPKSGGKETEAEDSAAQKRAALMEKTLPLVSSYAERNGIGVIFNAGGNSLNGLPVLVLARELPDLTENVIAEMR